MDYKSILKSIGWPIDCLVLDFESYWDKEYTLTKMSTIEYITDDRFECMGLGVWSLNSDEQEFIKPSDVKTILRTYNWDRWTVVMQNAKFDATILRHHYNIVPKYIIDVKDLSKHLNARASHKLKDLEERYNVKRKFTKKEIKTEGKHWINLTIPEREYHIAYTKDDAFTEGELFKLLFPKISRPEVEIPIMRHSLEMFLRPMIKVDYELANQLVVDMEKELKSEVRNASRSWMAYFKTPIGGPTMNTIGKDIGFAQMMQKALPDGEKIPTKPGKPTKNMLPIVGPGRFPAFATTDVEAINALKNHKIKLVQDLINARLAEASWPNHIGRVQKIVAQCKAAGGKLPVPLGYYGGHTGRYSGQEGINLQNLSERAWHDLINQIKHLLIAPDGYSFVILDASQIEARQCADMAGELSLVKQFRDGLDPYSVFASDLFQTKVRKPMYGWPKPLYELMYIRRYIGKQSVLGLQYGLGAKEFLRQRGQEKEMQALIKSGAFDFAFVERAVKLYRRTYKQIPKFWREVESRFKWVLQYGGEKEMPNGLKFIKEEGQVVIVLPSGRKFFYPAAHIEDGKIRWKYGWLWGGTLVENIIQAISRDFICEAILDIEAEGYPVVLMVHDSIICCVHDSKTMDAYAFMQNRLRTPPVWEPNVPLDCEGEILKRY